MPDGIFEARPSNPDLNGYPVGQGWTGQLSNFVSAGNIRMGMATNSLQTKTHLVRQWSKNMLVVVVA